MSTDHRRQHSELPDYEELCEAALGFIADGGNYTPAQIRQTIAQVYEIPPDHLALRLGNGTLAIRNYVAHVLRSFTLKKFHIRQGRGEDVFYTVTVNGMAAGRRIIGDLA